MRLLGLIPVQHVLIGEVSAQSWKLYRNFSPRTQFGEDNWWSFPTSNSGLVLLQNHLHVLEADLLRNVHQPGWLSGRLAGATERNWLAPFSLAKVLPEIEGKPKHMTLTGWQMAFFRIILVAKVALLPKAHRAPPNNEPIRHDTRESQSAQFRNVDDTY